MVWSQVMLKNNNNNNNAAERGKKGRGNEMLHDSYLWFFPPFNSFHTLCSKGKMMVVWSKDNSTFPPT